MAIINRDYLYTEFYDDIKDYKLPDGSLYLYEQDTEVRSTHCSTKLRDNNTTVRFIGIVERSKN